MPKEPKRGHRLNIFRGRFRYCSRTSQTEIASIDQLIMPVGLIKKAHPVFFDLYRIKFPVTAIVSIAHRISGVMLALFVPALVYLLQLSLASPQDFTNVVALFHQGVIRGIAVCLFWILAHHVLAGARHLLFDIHVGTSLHAARISGWTVLAVELGIV
ncbi:MAG TPA: succinate dehydrogenase, cytochrome b556 subunit [Burkholderiales bacterium]|nr:succinate dehydrogenase, cytochrome b556 subunit [Burkholderiales bacterium]